MQIKTVKDKAQYNKKLEDNQYLQKKLLEKIEENNQLKKHKQYLIDHILKLKYYEKAQDEMLRTLKNDKYSSKKESNTNIVLVTVQKESKLVKIQCPTHINAQKTMLVKENNIVKIPFRRPNHINRYPRKWELLKDNGTNVIKSLDDRSIGNPNNQQQINLGWIGPSTY